jgi:FO synthase
MFSRKKTESVDHIKWSSISPDVAQILQRSIAGKTISESQCERLFHTRDYDYQALLNTADQIRRNHCGDQGSFVITRNINFTNICYMGCKFCNFSKPIKDDEAEFLSLQEIVNRACHAWEKGATEVCIQGGLHPQMEADFYRNIVLSIKAKLPRLHVHAFSPFEIWYGARKAKMSYRDFLSDLKACGLDTMPGTAAEILDVEVRRQLTQNKLSTEEWVDIVKTAHRVGIPTTATMMYGHIDTPKHWAAHMHLLRKIQRETGGFTEFVPLGFIHYRTKLYNDNPALVRPGPTREENFKVHAIARLMFQGEIHNIQASWVKMGHDTVCQMLRCGANDLGGTLMNESISRAAGAEHGEEITPETMVSLIHQAGLNAFQRNTHYHPLQHYPLIDTPLQRLPGQEIMRFEVA